MRSDNSGGGYRAKSTVKNKMLERGKIRFLLMILVITFNTTNGLFGYDCSAPRSEAIQISLTDVGDCDLPSEQVNTTEIDIQLLQQVKYTRTRVFYCFVELDRLIVNCGMYSHISITNHGYAKYLKTYTREECQRMHETRRVKIADKIIDNLKLNGTTNYNLILGGTLKDDGECTGTSYQDQYGSWNGVTVIARGSVILQDYYVMVSLDEMKLISPKGARCDFKAGECLEVDGGQIFWDLFPEDICNFKTFSVLYQGKGTKISTDNEVVYSVTAEDITFALTAKAARDVCHFRIFNTEHPRLFVIENKTNFFKNQESIEPFNIELFSYFNSKLIYVEKHFRAQFKNLYSDIQKRRCMIEQRLLRESLTLAVLRPDEFALNYRNFERGYSAIVTGEVINIIKCTPVQVTIAKSDTCYQELKVNIGDNQTAYMSAKTRILKQRGTEVNCDPIMGQVWHLGNEWWQMSPEPVKIQEPLILKPDTSISWKYESPRNLPGGIFTDQALQAHSKFISESREQGAAINSLARIAIGEEVQESDRKYFHKFFDEKTISKIAKDTWAKLWSGFSWIGNISAGLLGIYFLARSIKLIVDTTLHFLTLKSAFGWSIYLICACWDSLTHFVLYLKKKDPANTRPTRTDPENPTPNPTQTPPNTPSNEPNPPSTSRTEENIETSYATVRYPALPPRKSG